MNDGNEDVQQEFVMLFAVFDEGNYPVDWCLTLNSTWSEAHALAMV